MCVSINEPGDRYLWPFDLETSTRFASGVGNLHFEFGHARPLGSRVVRYVRDGLTDGRTDRQMDKSNAYRPFPTGGGIMTGRHTYARYTDADPLATDQSQPISHRTSHFTTSQTRTSHLALYPRPTRTVIHKHTKYVRCQKSIKNKICAEDSLNYTVE